jgi:hypothetical protein
MAPQHVKDRHVGIALEHDDLAVFMGNNTRDGCQSLAGLQAQLRKQLYTL